VSVEFVATQNRVETTLFKKVYIHVHIYTALHNKREVTLQNVREMRKYLIFA